MKILVSGAGIAGLATARELGSRGHDVTVVESARSFRTTGTPIDIRGDAIEAVDRLGLLPAIQQHRVHMSERSHFVDGDGRPVASIPMAEISDSDNDIEILREDLMRVLAEALPETVTIHFGDSIDALTDYNCTVAATFASHRTGRYDLVVGADGQHSAVRGLVFGPADNYLRHLGVYFALADYSDEPQSESTNSIYNVPGRMAGVFRYGGRTVAVFQFRSDAIDYDHRDVNAQKQLLVEAFAGYRSWRIPELLDVARADPGFYFTSASQIRMSSWHHGRVVLVGDAGYSPAYLSGRGTSLALTGARLLAEALDEHGTDVPAAFAQYEARQRPYVDFAQNRVDSGRDRMLPVSWAAIAARNEALLTQHTSTATTRAAQ